MKRFIDILLIMMFLFLIIPLLIFAALLIIFFDSPPVLFRQQRVGINGKEFQLFKFRTMAIWQGNENTEFDVGSNIRVSSIGSFLRRTKLDELPQLWNVLRGDMSLVGPRPEVRKWVNVHTKRWAKVHQVLPGITDPASIVYRDEEQLLSKSDNPELTYRDVILPHKLTLYEKYVDERTLAGDFRILFQTIASLIR